MSNVIAMRAEADAIASRRSDAILRHPAGRRLLERQQQLCSLIAAIGDGRLSDTDDRDLPLIVGVLLHCCPQAPTEPDLVAGVVQDAADCFAAARAMTDGTPYAEQAAELVSSLANGTAEPTEARAWMLADWMRTVPR